MAENVVLYIADQMRADALGCYGQRVQISPNLDRLAEQGCRFDCAYTVTAQCAPARSSLMSGLYPSRHHVPANGVYLSPEDSAGRWFADRMATAWIGHWHLGADRERYGFDHNVYVRGGTDCPRSDDVYRRFLEERGYEIERYPYCPDDGFSNGAGPSRLKAEECFGSFLVDRAASLLERFAADGERFFLAVSDFAPHPPYVPPRPFDTRVDPSDVQLPANSYTRYERGSSTYEQWRKEVAESFDLSEPALRRLWVHYLGLCHLVDHNFGRVVSTLERLGLRDSTLIVFMADHGTMLGSHGLLRKGPGFYREQMRIPLLASGPGVRRGSTVDQPVSIVDIMPTIADCVGARFPDALDGTSLKPLLRGSSEQPTGEDRDAVLAEYHMKGGKPYPMRGIFTKQFKYHWTQWDGDELFDLFSDPGEEENLVERTGYDTIRRQLASRLAEELAWRRDPVASLIARDR